MGDGYELTRNRSLGVMRGYYNKSEVTEKAINAEGWYRTTAGVHCSCLTEIRKKGEYI